MGSGPVTTESSPDHKTNDRLPDLLFGPESERFEAMAAFVREHRGRAETPELRVHASDDMYKWSLLICGSEAVGTMAYFRSGMVLADTVRQVCAQWFGVEGPNRLLDFACGYGRALRFIVDDLGADRVSGCEILPDAALFVQSTLNATGLLSSSSPADLAIDGPYDLVVVSSLFSHLPEATFVPWLAGLYELVADGGLLLLTVHDESHLPDGSSMPEGGLWFQPTNEVPTLGTDEYGATVVSTGFVAAAIEQACGRPFRRFPKAWCFEQDVYVVPGNGDADLARLALRLGAQGAVDSVVASSQGDLAMTGWAATQDEAVRVADVEVRLDGRLLGRTVPSTARPDVQAHLGATHKEDCLMSGWELVARVTDPWPGSVLTVVAHTTDGRHDAIWGTRLGDCLDPAKSALSRTVRERDAAAPAPPSDGARRASRMSIRRIRDKFATVRARSWQPLRGAGR